MNSWQAVGDGVRVGRAGGCFRGTFNDDMYEGEGMFITADGSTVRY
jgi:hypothetical protein